MNTKPQSCLLRPLSADYYFRHGWGFLFSGEFPKKVTEMAKTRKNIGSRVRFEVFKRDSFTCQYCGKSAPQVVLNCDHIVAVANGGDESITNLVTSCVTCNSGKSSVPLSDESAVAKQKRQLDELSERRFQLDMMMQWKMEMLDMKSTEANHAIAYFEKRFNVKITDHGKPKIEKAIKTFGITEVLEAIDKSFGSYSDANKALDKIGGICNVTRQSRSDPEYETICRISGILKGRGLYLNYAIVGELVRSSMANGVKFDELRQIASSAKHWTAWRTAMEIGSSKTNEKSEVF